MIEIQPRKWKNQDLSGQDFTRDLTNTYFYQCILAGTKFGDLTNATFYACNMTGADLSKATCQGTRFINCTGLEDVLWPARFPNDSHEAVASVMSRAARTASRDDAPVYTDMAKVILEGKGRCAWEETVDKLFTKYGRTYATTLAYDAFGTEPTLLDRMKEAEKELDNVSAG